MTDPYDIEGYHVRFKHFRPRAETIDSYIAWFKRYPSSRTLATASIRAFLEVYEPEHYVRGLTKWEPSLFGGETFCAIYDNETRELMAVGNTICKYPDAFCYKAGRDAAFRDALRELKELHGIEIEWEATV